MSTAGFSYLWTYSGGLKLVEQFMCVIILIYLGMTGYNLQGYIFNTLCVVGLICTGVLLFFHIYNVIKRSKWPWHWIECVYVFTTGILFVIMASVSISVFTRGYIIIGALGYLTAMVYFFDTFDKYQTAIKPTPHYAWTTPNMPELS